MRQIDLDRTHLVTVEVNSQIVGAQRGITLSGVAV